MLAMRVDDGRDVAGRTICGIGVSSPQIVPTGTSADYDKPLQRARETIECSGRVRGRKGRVRRRGRPVNGYRMMPGPRRSDPDLSRCAEQAGCCASPGRSRDGVIINMLGERSSRRSSRKCARGPRRAGRTRTTSRSSCACSAPSPTTRSRSATRSRSRSARTSSRPVTTRSSRGRASGTSSKACARRAAKDRAASRAAVSDDILDALVVAGTADACGATEGVHERRRHDTRGPHFWPDPAALHGERFGSSA